MSTIDELLQEGIWAAKDGQVDEARRILKQVVEREPRNEAAWLWLSGVVETDEQRITCLENVLAINPHNKAAQRGLQALRQKAAVKPLPEMPPPSPAMEKPKPVLSRETMGCSIILLLLLIVIIALALYVDRSMQSGLPASPVQKPTPTKRTGPSLEVRLYMQEVADYSETFGQALVDLGELLESAKLTDERWLLAVAAQITIIRFTHQDLMEMDVPPEMAGIHNALLDATGDCDEAMDYLMSGIDNRSPTDLGIGAELMTNCSQKLRKPTELLEKYLAQFD